MYEHLVHGYVAFMTIVKPPSVMPAGGSVWREIVWGYMVKRLSAYGGCLGGNRR